MVKMRSIFFFALLLSMSGELLALEYRNEAFHTTVSIPDGWVSLPSAELTQLQTKSNAIRTVAGFRSPTADSDGFPYLIVQEYAPEMRGLNWEKIASTQPRPASYQSAAGPSAGPVYKRVEIERDRSRVLAHIAGDNPTSGKIEFLNCQFYTTQGILILNCYDRPDRFSVSDSIFRKTADAVRIDPGYEMEDQGNFDWNKILLAGAAGGGAVALLAIARTLFRRFKASH